MLYPETGTTKGEVIEYYARIAPVMLPHLAGRALTFNRFPNGVEQKGFFEKRCAKHRPDVGADRARARAITTATSSTA